MKNKLLIAAVLIIAFSACKKETELAPTTVKTEVPPVNFKQIGSSNSADTAPGDSVITIGGGFPNDPMFKDQYAH